MENCIFCKIIKGEIPSYKVWEDEKYFAILTIRPQKPGHTMVIPKVHEDYIFDLPDEQIKELAMVTKSMAGILKKAFKPKSGKIAMLSMGMGVPHVHIHLIPLERESDINPENAVDASVEELNSSLAKIRAVLSF